ncbi:MAG: sigma-70 family RNA polymerase sigma factor [Burkholderiales bacterium]
MQIDLASVVASDFPPLSKPQQLDIELIRAIAQGDKRAMHVLFAKHRLSVYRFALRLVDEKEAAEDLVSEAFLNVWRHAGRFEGRSRVSTWLLAITRNLAFSMLRRHPIEKLDDGKAAAIQDHADDPEAAVQKKQQSAILAHCLTKLSPAHREVIDLVYYHGRSIDEVAAIIRVPPSTVKTRIFYARKRIAKLLNGYRRASDRQQKLLHANDARPWPATGRRKSMFTRA